MLSSNHSGSPARQRSKVPPLRFPREVLRVYVAHYNSHRPRRELASPPEGSTEGLAGRFPR